MKTRNVSLIALLSTLLLIVIVLTTFAQNDHNSDVLTIPHLDDQVAQAIALAHLNQNKTALGLTAADLAEAKVSNITVSRLSGVTTIYLVQQLDGIEVFNGRINISIKPNGEVLTVGNRFVPNLSNTVSERTANVGAEQAVKLAAEHLELTLQTPLQILEQPTGPAQDTLLSDGGISQNPIPAKLVYDASGKEVRLAWNIIIYQLDSQHWWNVRVDANTGYILSQNDWVAHDHFDVPGGSDYHADQPVPIAPTPVADGSSYRAYHLPIESPNHSSPPAPADGRTLQNQPADAIGSPFGWHDTDGVTGPEFTSTQGNNVHAYTDIDANNTPDPGSSPDGGPDLDFDFPLDLTQPPSAYRPAAVTNLFHWNNLMHDISYRYGFDEAHGNFQENNYGNGGLGSDYMNAEAQDGMGSNCANVTVPPDGTNPRMQLCVWTLSTPARDGDLDSGIIAHEYGHGIVGRMVGVNCLSNPESMLEGWSDWQSLIMTMENGDLGTDPRGLGTYVLNQLTTGVGLRLAPYTTDMAVNGYTYGDLPGVIESHGVGFVWATMLWEMNWALIGAHGFNADLYPPTPPVNTWSGNQLAHALVMEGLNLTPCSPGFVDGRDAILIADLILTGGENECTIWAAFARRGLGFSASQGSPYSISDGTEAFDLPQSCLALSVTPTSQAICQGDTAVYTVNVGMAFTPPVAMSATGHPASSTATFAPNPVTAVPDTTNLTITNTGSVTAGNYIVNITGGDGVVTDTITVDLNIFADAPGSAPVLLTPSNTAVNIPITPDFSWETVSDAASYYLELADDINFTNIIYTATVNDTSHTLPGTNALAYNTWYYWRVTADNPCGSSNPSAEFSFRTVDLPAVFCSAPNAPIPDVGQLDDTLTIPANGDILDVDVYINAPHTWVGDLAFTISHNSTSAVIIDRPGRTTTGFGCSGDNYDVTVNDEGPDGDIETQCANAPAIFGNRVGGDPPNTSLLAAFDGMDSNGDWTLNVADLVAGDVGSLAEWCVLLTLETSGRAVDLSPDQAALGVPGSAVTYTLSLTNTGSLSDTFDLAVDALWPTSLSTTTVSLDAGAMISLTAVTTIPTNTLAGELTTTLVTATSQGDPGISDSSFLTTTATAVYGVNIHSDQTMLSGTVGTVVTYTMQISNTGNTTDTVALNAINDNGWLSDLSASSLLLAAGVGETVLVMVHVPANAAKGEMNVTTVTAVSANDASATDNLSLTTTATSTPIVRVIIYLPVILKPALVPTLTPSSGGIQKLLSADNKQQTGVR